MNLCCGKVVAKCWDRRGLQYVVISRVVRSCGRVSEPTADGVSKIDYKVVYQKGTGIIRGGGVEMLGLQTSHADIFKNNKACVKLESFKFVSHSNPRLQILEQFLEVTLQIVNENIHSSSKNKSAIVELEDNYPFELISQHIKTKTKDFPVFKGKWCWWVKVCMLGAAEFVWCLLDRALVHCDGNTSAVRPDVSGVVSGSVSVEGKAPVIYLAGHEHNWPQQLKSELKISKGYNTRVYVVITAKAPLDGRTLIQQLSNEPKADKLRFEHFCTTETIAADVGVARLLRFIGPVAYQVLTDLCSPVAPGTKTFIQLKTLLETHYAPTISVYEERSTFSCCKQHAGESYAAFSLSLRHLSSTCSFGTFLDDALKMQFYHNISSDMVREKIRNEESNFSAMVALATRYKILVPATVPANVNDNPNLINAVRPYQQKINKFKKKFQSSQGKNLSSRQDPISCLNVRYV
uniref:Uncharacterized protein n=1 Tax=Timema shepardi TaxID=629360 RepID=A0A7R9G3R2_TIMSH|nr:unnamed protein product [Timema shepardi]